MWINLYVFHSKWTTISVNNNNNNLITIEYKSSHRMQNDNNNNNQSWKLRPNFSNLKCLPLNVWTKLLLMICHSCASPTWGAITKCCFDGAITIERITPVPVTVIVRIYQWIWSSHTHKKKHNKYQNNTWFNGEHIEI